MTLKISWTRSWHLATITRKIKWYVSFHVKPSNSWEFCDDNRITIFPPCLLYLSILCDSYLWTSFLFYGLAFQAECYHYLLDACIKLYQLGIDWTTPEHGPINSAKRLCSTLSPEIPNGCHAAESSKVTSFFPTILGMPCITPTFLLRICLCYCACSFMKVLLFSLTLLWLLCCLCSTYLFSFIVAVCCTWHWGHN
jgi:hypothetical protein